MVKVLVVQVRLAQAVLLVQVILAQPLMAESESKHPTLEELLESTHQALVESQALISLLSVALVSMVLTME